MYMHYVSEQACKKRKCGVITGKASTEVLTQILYLKHYLKHNTDYLVPYQLHKIAIVMKIWIEYMESRFLVHGKAWKIVIRFLQISMNPLCYISCSLWQTSHLDVYCPVMLVTHMLATINNFSIMGD